MRWPMPVIRWYSATSPTSTSIWPTTSTIWNPVIAGAAMSMPARLSTCCRTIFISRSARIRTVRRPIWLPPRPAKKRCTPLPVAILSAFRDNYGPRQSAISIWPNTCFFRRCADCRNGPGTQVPPGAQILTAHNTGRRSGVTTPGSLRSRCRGWPPWA